MELGRISPRVPARVLRELAAVRRDVVAGRIRVPGAPPDEAATRGAAGALVVLAAVAVGAGLRGRGGHGSGAAQADPPDVVLVTRDCDSRHLCAARFVRAAKRTGARAR